MPPRIRMAPLIIGGLATSLATVTLGGTAIASDDAETAGTDDKRVAEATATARLDGNDVAGLRVRLDGRGEQRTMLIGLSTPDGAALQTYCVELHMPIDMDHPDMREVPWDAYPNPESPFHENRDRINWILHHSYPEVELSDIEAEVDHDFRNGLSAEEAIAATQAAIWHFSDGDTLARRNVTPGEPASGLDVRALYGYLTGSANDGIADPPDPELALAPASLTGESGTVFGPFQVSTTADSAAVTADLPDGVQLVDTDGAEIGATIGDGGELYVDVAESTPAGSGTVELSASVTMSLGRLFIGSDYENHPTQSLILAAAENAELAVTGDVKWTEPAQPEPTSEPTPEPTETAEPTESPEPEPTTEPTESPEGTQTPEASPSESPEETESPQPEPTDTPGEDQLPDTGAAPGTLILAGLVAVAMGGLVLARRRGWNVSGTV